MTPDLRSLAFEQASEHAIILLDSQGIIVDWKGAAETVFGYLSAEAIGRHVSVLFPPEDIPLGIPEFELTVAAKSGEANDDRWMMRKDGGRFWASGAVSPLRDQGEIVGYLKILRNRTDLKMHTTSIEQMVEAQGAQLRRKDQFIVTLAHDMRNPLLGIKMGAEAMAIMAAAIPESARTADLMRKEIAFLEDMVTNLMECAKSASGTLTLHKERFDFISFVREVVSSHSAKIGVTLELFVPQGTIDVEIDRTRMRQAIANLIENALKHTPEGYVWVEVSTDHEDVILHIVDTGLGIGAEQLPTIFEMFTQVESDDPPTGVGLGLSIVKDVLALHRGTVQALSDGIGKGSTFSIQFPRR